MNEEILNIIEREDKRFRDELYRVTDLLCAKKDLKIIRLSGPTCAGKTTAAKMIVNRMKENGKNAIFVSIDDFYYDREYMQFISERKGFDGIDYDSEDTIDIELLSEFIEQAFSSSEVNCPVFSFPHGRRIGERRIEIKENDIFIFEGIQAVYPKIFSLFGSRCSASIFITPLEQINDGGECFEPNEIRLMRRIVRDYNFRDTDVDQTMTVWKNVRENEEKNIFPYISKCDHLINSSMSYEIGVLRPYLERILKEHLNGEYSRELSEMLEKLIDVTPIPSEYIAENSLYKEFV